MTSLRAPDILLNTIAAVFVLDIDNYAFEYFATDFLKQLLTGFPPLGMLTYLQVPEGVDPGAESMGADDVAWQFFAGLVLGPILIVLATVLYQGWCGDDDLALALGFGLPAACVLCGCFWLRTQDGMSIYFLMFKYL